MDDWYNPSGAAEDLPRRWAVSSCAAVALLRAPLWRGVAVHWGALARIAARASTLIPLAIGIATAIDVGVRTGNVGAALGFGMLAGASSYLGGQIVEAGLGVVAEQYGALAAERLRTALSVIGLPTGAYGVPQAAENGMYATAVVGAALLAIGAYRLFRGRSTAQGVRSKAGEAGQRSVNRQTGGISVEQLKLNARYYRELYRVGGVTYGGARAANVLVTQEGHAITFEASVNLEGAASQSHVRATEREWSGKFGRYEVRTRVRVVRAAGDFLIRVDSGVTRAHVDCLGCAVIKLGPRDSGWTAAHEFGHVMGLPDRCVDIPGMGSLALPGWEGNIVAEYGGRVWDRDIYYLLNWR